MENFKFKSQVATSVEQSKRLLELGLKKETADCGHFYVRREYEEREDWQTVIFDYNWKSYWNVTDKRIPAWSLHRLLCLIPKEVNIDGFKFPLRSDVIMRLEDADFMYERLIGVIERVIKEGYFNKDYLEERK